VALPGKYASSVWFCSNLIKWMMTFFTTVKFFVRLNGRLLGSFHPSRGLRQGDPSSPYLFLFDVEALSLLLTDTSARGVIQDFWLNKHAPGISHLLFADDSLLFFKGTLEQVLAIKGTLSAYEEGACQLLSPNKCSILFGKKCSLEDWVSILVILKIMIDGFEDKYLGLPVP
jgi:hypothetical protein